MPRVNVSLPKPIQYREKVIREVRGFQGLSDTLQTLVREEYERRIPPIINPTKSAGAEGAKVVDEVKVVDEMSADAADQSLPQKKRKRGAKQT